MVFFLNPIIVYILTDSTREKTFGVWKNLGDCTTESKGPDGKPCGPGLMKQRRKCIDGKVERCGKKDKQRTVPCTGAGKSTPACPGKCSCVSSLR